MNNWKAVDKATGSPVRRAARYDASRITTMRNHPERCFWMALGALQRGWSLGRKMTELERISLAVASAKPTYFVTISTADATHEELARMFRELVSRLERRRSTKKPLIYFRSFARGLGKGGSHLHMLLWENPYISSYVGQSRKVGLGRIDVQKIDSTPVDALLRACYVLGQSEPVFGTTTHEHHQMLGGGKRRFSYPQMKTLEKYHPELCYVLDLAKDKSVSDETLFSKLPIFIRQYRGGLSADKLDLRVAQTSECLLPQRVQNEAQRILNVAARRLLDKQIYTDAFGTTTGTDTSSLDYSFDKSPALIEREPIPIRSRRDGYSNSLAA